MVPGCVEFAIGACYSQNGYGMVYRAFQLLAACQHAKHLGLFVIAAIHRECGFSLSGVQRPRSQPRQRLGNNLHATIDHLAGVFLDQRNLLCLHGVVVNKVVT